MALKGNFSYLIDKRAFLFRQPALPTKSFADTNVRSDLHVVNVPETKTANETRESGAQLLIGVLSVRAERAGRDRMRQRWIADENSSIGGRLVFFLPKFDTAIDNMKVCVLVYFTINKFFADYFPKKSSSINHVNEPTPETVFVNF
jgi:hypothetical protein